MTDPTLSGRGTFLHDTVYVNISGHVWELASALDGYTETFTQMLSTFHVSGPTAGWKTFTNTAYGYTFKYPNDVDSDVYGNEYGKQASVASSVGVPGSLVNNVRQSALFSVEAANPRYSNPNDAALKLSLKDFATKVWEGNKNDKNPNIPNKEVGDLTETTVAGQVAYSLTVTGSFKDYIGDGGYVLNEEHTYYIVEYGGNKYLLWHPSAQTRSKAILSTLTFTK
ncbi:MAG: hypothetical protein AAB402_01165 [Patescibacteria group bacterium]